MCVIMLYNAYVETNVKPRLKSELGKLIGNKLNTNVIVKTITQKQRLQKTYNNRKIDNQRT